MSRLATRRRSNQRLSHPGEWLRRHERAAALSLALAACAASTLAAASAGASDGGYIVTATIRVGVNPRAVAVSPDGSHIDVSSSPGVSVIDAATNRVTATIPHVGGEIAFSPDGKDAYIGNGESVSVIDTATNHVTAPIPVNGDTGQTGIAVSPDGRHVYFADGGGSLKVIDPPRQRLHPRRQWPGRRSGQPQRQTYLRRQPLVGQHVSDRRRHQPGHRHHPRRATPLRGSGQSQRQTYLRPHPGISGPGMGDRYCHQPAAPTSPTGPVAPCP
jgi:YVTN family beta-propeller protein